MPVSREVEGQKDVNGIIITNRQDHLILVGFINFQDELDKNERKRNGRGLGWECLLSTGGAKRPF